MNGASSSSGGQGPLCPKETESFPQRKEPSSSDENDSRKNKISIVEKKIEALHQEETQLHLAAMASLKIKIENIKQEEEAEHEKVITYFRKTEASKEYVNECTRVFLQAAYNVYETETSLDNETETEDEDELTDDGQRLDHVLKTQEALKEAARDKLEKSKIEHENAVAAFLALVSDSENRETEFAYQRRVAAEEVRKQVAEYQNELECKLVALADELQTLQEIEAGKLKPSTTAVKRTALEAKMDMTQPISDAHLPQKRSNKIKFDLFWSQIGVKRAEDFSSDYLKKQASSLGVDPQKLLKLKMDLRDCEKGFTALLRHITGDDEASEELHIVEKYQEYIYYVSVPNESKLPTEMQRLRDHYEHALTVYLDFSEELEKVNALMEAATNKKKLAEEAAVKD